VHAAETSIFSLAAGAIPDDCDGNVCTVGDRCVASVCQPGSVATAGQLSGFVFDRTHAAAAACARDRRKLVKKVVGPLGRVDGLLGQASAAPSAKKRAKKLAQARHAAGQAEQQLTKVRGRLSPSCVASLDLATAGTRTALSCLP
jgi:hypothetical protein